MLCHNMTQHLHSISVYSSLALPAKIVSLYMLPPHIWPRFGQFIKFFLIHLLSSPNNRYNISSMSL